MAWSGHVLTTDAGPAVARQRVLPRAVQLRLHRHPARLRAGRHDRRRAGGRAAPLQHHVRAGARARLPRGVRAGPPARRRAGPAPRWPRPRSPTRRGGWRRPATCTCCPPAASRSRWPCSPAGTAGRCATATGPTGGTPAGRWPAGSSPPGRSASASASACRSRTCSPLVAVVSFVTWRVRRTWFWAVRRPFGGAAVRWPTCSAAWSSPPPACCMALPYFKVVELHPYARRSVDELELYSPPLNGFFIAPAGVARLGRAARRRARGAALGAGDDPAARLRAVRPGARRPVLLDLDGCGSGCCCWPASWSPSSWPWAPGSSAGTPATCCSTTYLPGWDGLRTPGRLILWTTLLLGILAAGAVSAFVRRGHETRREPAAAHRLGFWLRLATLRAAAAGAGRGPQRHPAPGRAAAARRRCGRRRARCWCCPATTAPTTT